MEYIVPLPKSTPTPSKLSHPLRLAGYRYQLDTKNLADCQLGDLERDLQTGLLGNYQLSLKQAMASAVDMKQVPVQVFVWNSELLDSRLINCLLITSHHPQLADHNRLTLLDAGMAAPEVRSLDNTPTLSITPSFELEWVTAAHGSQLGVLQLVESTRTLHFADGGTMTLLDTEATGGSPVLYLTHSTNDGPVLPLGTFQEQGQQHKLLFSQEVSQAVPAEIAGNAVASVSVLEKYTVYFMQNAGPEQQEQYIWVPVHLPVVWGWSIRVQQRYDGVWDIFRKKLLMPSASTEAPRLPLWQSNSLLCQTAQVI